MPARHPDALALRRNTSNTLQRIPPLTLTLAQVRKSGVEMGTLDPFELGFSKCSLADLKGGSAQENAQILKDVLAGKLPGPVSSQQ